MKVKILFILLSVLLVIPAEAVTFNHKKHRSHLKRVNRRANTSTRSPLDFNMSLNDGDNVLQIIFQGSMPDAEITVTDKNGNTVVYEPQTFINEGEMIYIYTPNAYPYTIEITSPVMDVTGEITQEEI